MMWQTYSQTHKRTQSFIVRDIVYFTFLKINPHILKAKPSCLFFNPHSYSFLRTPNGCFSLWWTQYITASTSSPPSCPPSPPASPSPPGWAWAWQRAEGGEEGVGLSPKRRPKGDNQKRLDRRTLPIITLYENHDIAIAMAPSCADPVLPWLGVFKCLIQCYCTVWGYLNI